MSSLPRFSYTRLFVSELHDEGNGLKRIITSSREDVLGVLTDGQARFSHGICWFDRLPENKGILPVPFKGIVLAKDVSQSTTIRYSRSRPMGQYRIQFPDSRTVITGRDGSEWVYFIDNDRTVFTVLTGNVDSEHSRYVGPQYVPIPKTVKMAMFTETFGTVSNCYRGQLITGGRLSVEQFKRILRANGIDPNLNKTQRCEALEQLREFVWA